MAAEGQVFLFELLEVGADVVLEELAADLAVPGKGAGQIAVLGAWLRRIRRAATGPARPSDIRRR